MHMHLFLDTKQITDVCPLLKKLVRALNDNMLSENLYYFLINLKNFLWISRTFISLREKCPNTEFFVVRIFPHSDWVRRDTEYPSKCGEIRTRKNSVFGHFSRSVSLVGFFRKTFLPRAVLYCLKTDF